MRHLTVYTSEVLRPGASESGVNLEVAIHDDICGDICPGQSEASVSDH